MRKLTTDEITTLRLSPDGLVEAHRLPVVAVLEDVRSLYNVGSIFRTADAVLLSKLFLTGYTPKPPRPEIEKTALGATRTIPWEAHRSAPQVLQGLREQGYTICALETTDTSESLYTVRQIEHPLALVFGNEITGIRSETLALCDHAWEIPMHGTKHSLNVAVAFGIALYEVSRRLR